MKLPIQIPAFTLLSVLCFIGCGINYLSKDNSQISINKHQSINRPERISQAVLDIWNYAELSSKYFHSCFNKNGEIDFHTIASASSKKKHQEKNFRQAVTLYTGNYNDILNSLGEPDLQTKSIIFWRGQSFDTSLRFLFDRPAEQWWYQGRSDKYQHVLYSFVIGTSGKVIGFDQAVISKASYPNWQTYASCLDN